MSATLPIVGAHFRLSANLLLRFGAPLGAIWMSGYLLNILLMRAGWGFLASTLHEKTGSGLLSTMPEGALHPRSSGRSAVRM